MTAQQLFGPMLIGVLFNGILYGALVVQLFTYYDRYYKSDPFVRYLVVYLLIAETANTVFDINLIYQPLVTGWGNLEQLQKSPLFLRPDAAVTVAISTPVQLFMAWRLQRLTKHSVMPGIILLLALVSLAGGLSVTIKVSLQQDYSAFPAFKPFTTVWLAATAACDLLLSTALIYSLKVRKTGVGPTDRYIDRVIRLTIQTGSITAVAALLDLFVFLFAPSATLQFIWDFPLSKLYSNALLSSLNSRPWKEELAPPLTLNVLYEPTPPPNARTSALEFADVLVPGMGGETELHQRARHVAFQATDNQLLPLALIQTMPLETIPNELLAEIFLCYIPPYPQCPPFHGDESPTQLALVSRLWRAIALSTPTLWRAMRLDMDRSDTASVQASEFARRWLLLSGSLPLSLVFRCHTRRHSWRQSAVFQELVDCSARWEYVDLEIPPSTSYVANIQPGSVRRATWATPRLLHLRVVVYMKAESVLPRHGFDAPRLQSLSGRLTSDELYFKMVGPSSWDTLTTLKLRDVPPVFAARILAQTPALIHCWMRIWKDRPEPVSERSIVLPHLKTFFLDAALRESMNELLGPLVLPELTALAIKEAFLHFLALESTAGPDGEKDVASTLLQLLQRWGCDACVSELAILRSSGLFDADRFLSLLRGVRTAGRLDILLNHSEEWEPREWGTEWDPQGV
uniref:DUF6534 domain-containing protein n=1 Tax=Mycena chlorophos TaxID=658473 RepID=A0ABQ0L173_MYCCL|nr:predicted protein [Mycena chlorophos]